METYETLLSKAKYLKEGWLKCNNDAERIIFAQKHRPSIVFILDNDNTTVHFNYDWTTITQGQSDDVSEAFGCHFLENDLGNRSGIEYLLNALGIEWRRC